MQIFRNNPAATLFPLMLAGFLASMSYWLEMTSRPPKNDHSGKSRHAPDYIIDHFNVRRFNAAGELQHTMIADRMQHFADDDTTLLTEPRLIYHRVPATYIEAREAHIDGKGEHVELLKEVRLLRTGVSSKPPTELRTEQLDAYPDDEYVHSGVPVQITQGQSRVTGSTLDANNKSSTYTLDGNVQGMFYRGRPASLAAAKATLVDEALPQAAVPVQPLIQTKPSKRKTVSAADRPANKTGTATKTAEKTKPQAKSPKKRKIKPKIATATSTPKTKR